MSKETIKCTRCGNEIELSEAFSQNIEARIKQEYEAKIAEVQSNAETQIKNKDKESRQLLEQEKAKLTKGLREEIEAENKTQINGLKEQLNAKASKLEEAQRRELNLQKKEMDLAEKERDLEIKFNKNLEIERSKNKERVKEIEQSIEQLKKSHDEAMLAKESESKRKLESEKIRIQKQLREDVENEHTLKLAELESQLTMKSKKLEEAQKNELAIRMKQNELEEKEKEFELEMVRKMDQERERIARKAAEDVESKNKLKLADKDKQLDDLRRQIEDMKKKADQGSQKAQGEVLEIELEDLLRSEFAFDIIEPVASGARGADVIQTVKTQTGKDCGKILWEAKRTKNWSDTWLQKMKNDQRDAKADIAVIVSEALPKEVRHFKKINDVWVTDVQYAVGLAVVLRTLLVQVARAKWTQDGKEGKKELIYNYFTGVDFKNRVEAIVEGFTSMKASLDVEKNAMNKIWAKREKEIEKVLTNTISMRGEIEGIAGTALPEIRSLELESIVE